jgi:hypothetical protein
MKVEYKLVLAIVRKIQIYADAFGRSSDQIIFWEDNIIRHKDTYVRN